MNTRKRAAAAMNALANRYESIGKKPAALVDGPEWVVMPCCPGMKMHRGHLQAAIEYYEFAAMIDPEDPAHAFSKALVLEVLGDWQDAVVALQMLAGTIYDEAARVAMDRCRDKATGGPANQLSTTSILRVAEWEDHDATFEIEGAITSLARARARRHRQRSARSKCVESDVEDAAQVARSFVHLLLDRQWSAAHAMLAPEPRGPGPEVLRDAFEGLFGADPFPVSADVFDVQTDLDQLRDADLGWVHVAIPSDRAEAVSLVVTRDTAGFKVRDVAFGYP